MRKNGGLSKKSTSEHRTRKKSGLFALRPPAGGFKGMGRSAERQQKRKKDGSTVYFYNFREPNGTHKCYINITSRNGTRSVCEYAERTARFALCRDSIVVLSCFILCLCCGGAFDANRGAVFLCLPDEEPASTAQPTDDSAGVMNYPSVPFSSAFFSYLRLHKPIHTLSTMPKKKVINSDKNSFETG